jgi:hypothetical protein
VNLKTGIPERVSGVRIPPSPPLPYLSNACKPVIPTLAEFLDETKLTKKPKTHSAYSTALNYFLDSCPKLQVEDVERKDLLKLSAFRRDCRDLSRKNRRHTREKKLTCCSQSAMRRNDSGSSSS